MNSMKKRLVSVGVKPKYPELEEALAAYIKEIRSRNLHVTTKAVQRKALELLSSSTPANHKEPSLSSNKPFVATDAMGIFLAKKNNSWTKAAISAD